MRVVPSAFFLDVEDVGFQLLVLAETFAEVPCQVRDAVFEGDFSIILCNPGVTAEYK